jgi:UDP-N-acetylmuramate--alanine ligase
VYAASEAPIPGVSSLTISKGMDASKVIFEPSMLKVVEEIAKNAKSGDVILTLGAGDVSSLGEPILQAIADR